MAEGRRNDEMMKQALTEEILAEISALEAALDERDRRGLREQAAAFRPLAEKRLLRKLREANTQNYKRRLFRWARVAAVAVLTLCVGFGGVCLASPEIRENLFRFVEKQWGRYREVKMYYEGGENVQYATAIAADDPRLAYVWNEWPLHYYPLYLPEEYLTGERCFTWQGQPGTKITEEEQAYADALIAADLAAMQLYSTTPDERNYITFAESGQKNFTADFESETNEIIEKTIDGRDVIMVKIAGSYRCYWQQDDHILTLSTTGITQDEVEKIIAGVERIR